MIGAIKMIAQVACMLALCITVPVQSRILDVPALQGMKKDWPKLAQQQKSISLEGRFAARTGKLLRLQNCDLVFRVTSGVTIPRLRNDRNVELVGYLKDTGKQIDFIVLRIAEGSSDLEDLARDRRRLPEDNPKAWYDLAERTRQRAAFYEDSELLAASRKLVEDAFELERSQVRNGDAAALRKLADRATELGLPLATRNEMIHRSLRWRWDALRRKPAADQEAFLKVLEQELRGAIKPVMLPNARLRDDYRKDPIAAYRKGTLTQRELMHRYFYREVLLPQIERRAEENGSNGAEVARLLRDNIPEEADLADDYEDRERQWRLENVESATRADMLELVDQLQRTNQRKAAADAKRHWVRASERRLAGRGPAGLVQSATEYDSLLGDRDKAIRLLKQAWDESSEKAEIEERLERYGVYRRENKWMNEAEVAALPENQMARALREGKVIPGMTPEQVMKTLGKPDRVSRFASRSRVQIVWLFDQGSAVRSSIVFERKLTSDDSVPRVLSVSTLPGK